MKEHAFGGGWMSFLTLPFIFLMAVVFTVVLLAIEGCARIAFWFTGGSEKPSP